jgi:hypothetical protein
MSGFVVGVPRTVLRLEGLFVLIAAIVAYAMIQRGWWFFAALFFAPDLSMLGYLIGSKSGAAIYNFAHSYVTPLVVIGAALFWSMPSVLAAGVIWVAHIGFDRMLGYGLKYADDFHSTHLGRVGRASASG